MKKLVIALAGLAITGSAWAADIPVKAPAYKAPAVAPIYNWTGFYVGANAGYGWGHSDITSFLDPIATLNRQTIGIAASPSLRPSGFTGGLQAGYNYQVNRIVFGLETEIDYFHLSDSQGSTTAYPVLGGNFTVNSSVKTDWLFTLRPRIGYAVDRFMVYGTGGLAVTRVKYDVTLTDTFGTNDIFSAAQTKAGWTAGGGLEYALGNHWTVKGEYLYTHFDSLTAAPTFTGAAATVFRHEVPLNASIVRVGANYKFD